MCVFFVLWFDGFRLLLIDPYLVMNCFMEFMQVFVENGLVGSAVQLGWVQEGLPGSLGAPSSN
jgi:hypothetical protein